MRVSAPDFPSQRQVPGYWWDATYVDDGFLASALPPSHWDDRALAHIEQHLIAEADTGQAYEAFAAAGDPAVKYLADLIAEDERRHHKILARIAETLRSYVGEEISQLTVNVSLSPEQRASLLDETHRLLDIERHDATALKELRRDLRTAPDDTMWPVMIELMAADTEKHIAILKGIERHLKRG